MTALIGNICTFASAFISDRHWQPCATCACVSVVRFRDQLTRVALGAIRRVQPAMVAARLSLFLCLPRASACAFAFRRYQTHLLQSPRVCLSKSGSTLGRPSASHASTTGQFILAVSKTIKLNQSHLYGHELLHFRIPDQCQKGGHSDLIISAGACSGAHVETNLRLRHQTSLVYHIARSLARAVWRLARDALVSF